jgi:acid phosphatase type 7
MRLRSVVLVTSLAALCGWAASPSPDPSGSRTKSYSLLAAGDIAWCGRATDDRTARLVAQSDAVVLALGDLAYRHGTHAEFRDCYGRSWGRFKDRTRPVPGNHEYEQPGAAPYFEYFGSRAGRAGVGYYSFELDGWHVVALNSHVDARAGSTQLKWLRDDLDAHPARCTLAYWHEPLFSSGMHGGSPVMREAWRVLQEHGADVVLSGHDHIYERFAPQNADGARDPARGIREFVVGTGGAPLYVLERRAPHSEARNDRAYGVLALELEADGYRWEFLRSEGRPFEDEGSGRCH